MTDLEKAAGMLNKSSAKKISGKMQDIEKITVSPEGKAVETILEQNGDRLTKAFENNDAAAMAQELSNIMKTEAGASVISQLAKLLD